MSNQSSGKRSTPDLKELMKNLVEMVDMDGGSSNRDAFLVVPLADGSGVATIPTSSIVSILWEEGEVSIHHAVVNSVLNIRTSLSMRSVLDALAQCGHKIVARGGDLELTDKRNEEGNE